MCTVNKLVTRLILLIAVFIFVFNGKSYAVKELQPLKKNQKLTGEQIRKLAEEFLLERVPWSEDQMNLRVEYGGKDIILPKGKRQLVFQTSGNRWRPGVVPLILNIKVDNKFQRRLRLSAVLEIYYNVVKARNPLKRGQVLTNSDVEVGRVRSSHTLKGVANRMEEVVGHKLRRNLDQGSVISLTMLKRPPLVKRGDRVLIVAQRGSLKITTPGIVREKGFENSMVKVENIQSKKIIYARVLSSSMVAVEF